MKRLALLIATPLICVAGALASSLTQRADSAYMADDFPTALTLYTEASQTEGTSSQLWYNIGNTEYRMGRIGRAIVAYERSLKLDPANADARANLDFVASKTVDRPADSGSFISNSLDSTTRLMRADAWAWTAFGLFAVTLAAIALYIFGRGVALRKTGFFSGIIMAIATVGAGCIALRGARMATTTDRAVVTAKSTILSTSPRAPKDRTEEAMLLHEGTRMAILDSVTAPGDTTGLRWYDVSIDNSHRAWIRSTDVERI